MTKFTKEDIYMAVRDLVLEGIHWTQGLTRKDVAKIVHLNHIVGVSDKDRAVIGKKDQQLVYSFIHRHSPWMLDYFYKHEYEDKYTAPFKQHFSIDPTKISYEYWLDGIERDVEDQLGKFHYWINFPKEQMRGSAKLNRHWILRYKWARETFLKYPTFERDTTKLLEFIRDLRVQDVTNPHNPKNYPLYVSLYESIQSYGGPEEGGWTYTHNTLIKSIKVNSFEEARRAAAKLLKEVGDYMGRDAEPHIYLEKEEGGEVTKERPRYG